MEKNIKESGVILLKNRTDGEILVTDIYNGEERETLWKEWLSVASDRYRKNPERNSTLILEDYRLPNTRSMEGRSDKQIAFLLENLRPDRQIEAAKAAFAGKKKKGITEPSEINRIVGLHQSEYDRFLKKGGNTVPLMTSFDENFGKRLLPGNITHAERVFTLKENFSFVGKERIRNTEDVAWIFRQLENKGTEHSFVVMTKGKKSIILETGIGNLTRTAVDIAAVVKANKKFNPEKIYMVHNHPSGKVLASLEDKLLWSRMKEAFGNKFQPGIILNTDTGTYGIFSDTVMDGFVFDERQDMGETVNIPVFSFDRVVFNKEYRLLDMMQITNSRDVAMFISSQRFGERDKYAFLALNTNMKILGNFHLPVNDLTKDNLEKMADYITETVITAGGCGAIVYGKDEDNRMMMSTSYLNELVSRTSGRSVSLIDCVTSDGNDVWKSACEEGILEAVGRNAFIAYEEKERWQKIDIISISDGSCMIRVKIDGNYLPAEKLRKVEQRKYMEGKLSKEELADKYFPKDMKEQNGRGMKR